MSDRQPHRVVRKRRRKKKKLGIRRIRTRQTPPKKSTLPCVPGRGAVQRGRVLFYWFLFIFIDLLTFEFETQPYLESAEFFINIKKMLKLILKIFVVLRNFLKHSKRMYEEQKKGPSVNTGAEKNDFVNFSVRTRKRRKSLVVSRRS